MGNVKKKMTKGYEGMEHTIDTGKYDSEGRGTRSSASKGMFSMKDGEQAYMVHNVSTLSGKDGNERMSLMDSGSRGYPQEAWNYGQGQ